MTEDANASLVCSLRHAELPLKSYEPGATGPAPKLSYVEILQINWSADSICTTTYIHNSTNFIGQV